MNPIASYCKDHWTNAKNELVYRETGNLMERLNVVDSGPFHDERQVAGNLKKLTVCNTGPITTLFISHIFNEHKQSRGLTSPICCHGSRQGCEPMMFSLFTRHYSIGTDISPSGMFSGLVFQHDFHRRMPYRQGLIYSNSYDQSNRPRILFSTWIEDLENNGFMALEYEVRSHGQDVANKLDPFGTSLDGLISLLTECAREINAKVNIYVSKHPDNSKSDSFIIFLFKGNESCNPEEFSEYLNNAKSWLCKDGEDQNQCPLYSPLDTERSACLRSQILAYSQAQVLQAASLTQPDSFLILCAQRIRSLMKLVMPSYSYERLAAANASQTFTSDLLTLLDDPILTQQESHK